MNIDDRIRTRLNKLVAKAGKTITYRRVNNLVGPNPAVNPPSTGSLQASAAAIIGATTISLTAPSVSGRLIVGDMLCIGGNDYTITAQSIASGNVFTNVAITPPLLTNVSINDPVNATFVADMQIQARISGYSDNVIAGTLVQMGDLQLIVPATQLSFTPAITDKLIVDGIQKSIITVAPQFAASKPGSWRIQAR